MFSAALFALIGGMLPASCALGMITGFPGAPQICKETDMKLYYHPVSTTSRPGWLFLAEHGIACALKVAAFMKGEHYQTESVTINPNRRAPVLGDGAARLTEPCAIP